MLNYCKRKNAYLNFKARCTVALTMRVSGYCHSLNAPHRTPLTQRKEVQVAVSRVTVVLAAVVVVVVMVVSRLCSSCV